MRNSVKDSVLGLLRRKSRSFTIIGDRKKYTIHSFAGSARLRDRKVNLVFEGTDDGDLAERELEVAREVVPQLARYTRDAKVYASKKLLRLKNSTWLEGERPVSDAAFRRRIVLDEVEFGLEGDVTFHFLDGDLFWGHSIEVGMTRRGKFRHAGIVG